MKRNILANLAGGIANAALMLLITPTLIAILGPESYGLVSLIATLQVVVGALDLGLSATVTRSVASGAEQRSASAALINSAATIYWALAAVIGVSLYASAGTIVDNFVRSAGISQRDLIDAVQMIAIYLAIRWPVAFYAGVISGAQQMLTLNLIKTGCLTLRLLGGVAVILAHPSLIVLLLWYVATAALELLICAYCAFRVFPALSLRLRLDFGAIRRSLGFSGTMYGLALLSMLLTQIDKLTISKFLDLESLGFYSVAYNLALGLSLIQLAINNAAMPLYAKTHSVNQSELLRHYTKVSRLLGFTLSAPAIALMIFGQDVLTLWVGPHIAASSAPSLILLSAAFLLNGFASNSYVAAVGMGRPTLFLSVNLAIAIPYMAVLLLAVRQYGIVGAAGTFLALNIVYMITAVPWAHSQLQIGLLRHWLMRDTGPFVILAVICLTIGYLASRLLDEQQAWLRVITGLSAGGILYGWVGLRRLAPEIGHEISNRLLGRQA